MTLQDFLMLDEGLKLKPYRCTKNKLTIGVGRNIEDLGITKDEAFYLLNNDIERVKKELSRFFWFETLDNARQNVMINMCFALGLPRFLGFKDTIKAVARGDYNTAAAEIMDSKWAREEGKNRATRLSRIMRSGKMEDYYVQKKN